jgi:hypothetical protein
MEESFAVCGQTVVALDSRLSVAARKRPSSTSPFHLPTRLDIEKKHAKQK